MRGILLISHGHYADEFCKSLKMISGDVDNIYVCCLEASDGPETFSSKLEKIKPYLDSYDEVLVFADLFGGSPCNTAFQYFINEDKYIFIAGMNFPMVLNAIISEDIPIEEIMQIGKDGIIDVREYIKNNLDDEID